MCAQLNYAPRKTKTSDIDKMPISHEGGKPQDWEWFEVLFRTYHAPLCGFVYRYVASSETSEDVVQDLFLSIWRNKERWMSKGEQVTPAMYVAARNRALDYIKHGKVRTRHRDEVREVQRNRFVPAPDADLVYGELMAEVEEAVSRLPERCRLVFTLSRDSALTNLEIATMLGVSIKTVEAQMTRALGALRSQLIPHLVSLLLAGVTWAPFTSLSCLS